MNSFSYFGHCPRKRQLGQAKSGNKRERMGRMDPIRNCVCGTTLLLCYIYSTLQQWLAKAPVTHEGEISSDRHRKACPSIQCDVTPLEGAEKPGHALIGGMRPYFKREGAWLYLVSHKRDPLTCFTRVLCAMAVSTRAGEERRTKHSLPPSPLF